MYSSDVCHCAFRSEGNSKCTNCGKFKVNQQMTKEEITAGNKLIAVFMGGKLEMKDTRNIGLELCTDVSHLIYGDIWTKTGNNWIIIEKLKYHSSWELLMPVVEKIGELMKETWVKMYSEKGIYECTIDYLDNPKEDSLIFISNNYSLIEVTYKAVIKFIEWYNSQQTT